MIRVPFISCAFVLAVAACSQDDPVDKQANATAGLPDVNASAPTTVGEPHEKTGPARPLPTAASRIPAAFVGQWGLTPADCMPNRSDAKGLLTITPGELQFYESRAVPTADVQTDGSSLSGNFAFTGEGQSWVKYEALKANKQVLVRTETDPRASLTYAKCN